MQNNTPDLWLQDFPKPELDGHKYDRGHALIYGAPELTGATRLVAGSCARIGAGMVSVISPEKGDIYRASLPAHILVRDKMPEDLGKITACLLGPGGLPGDYDAALDVPYVLDAEAIMTLKGRYPAKTVLTPHEGEFGKAFPEVEGSREDRALAAALENNAVIVLKGPETLIAGSDGRIAVNKNSSPYLATAGTGDVLAGLITGLIAQGMDPFQASCAGVWIHSQAALQIGPGLVASDIPAEISAQLAKLKL